MTDLNPHQWQIAITFIIGYLLITVEHIIQINKAAIALLLATICWSFQFLSGSCPANETVSCLGVHLASIGQIVFFILSALTIVEIINMYGGFRVISDNIPIMSKRRFLWVIGIITFFLSAVLDNLTTTIVMVSLLQKLISVRQERLLIGAGIVIAANAGGAWTPIGDVTTTMLWIGGQLTTEAMITRLFLPSVACLAVALGWISLLLKGEFTEKPLKETSPINPRGTLVFYLGVGLLIFVPIFKVITGMPPFMGILFGLALLWMITDLLHVYDEKKSHLDVPHALSKIDLSSMLFFLGILLAIDALDSSGLLHQIALWMDHAIGNTSVIATLIGLASAVVDNVPLVAASMAMYDVQLYLVDSSFWELIAYCAGTGGSVLIIGSAAGVVYMGLERVTFFWYLRNISLPALAGYFSGIGVYLLLK